MTETPEVPPSAAQLVADRVFATLERILHVEAVSGSVLLAATLAAIVWANSPFGETYSHLWHSPLLLGFGSYTVAQPLHFWLNDGLMTVFFLVVGMEVRREIHEGALASPRLAALPFAAALGGVVLPAAFYLALNELPAARHGWAVGTATDIAFAVGVLALLGRSVPTTVRVFLLSIAIIDDVIAVLIIAVFYSEGLDLAGFLVAGAGIALVLGMQHLGIGSAWAYTVPGAIIWFGLLWTGAHPTLAGVVLGLMTPVRPQRNERRAADHAADALEEVKERALRLSDPHDLVAPLRRLRRAQRELLPPVVRVQLALHPWVAYGIVPLFALANAGVRIEAGTLTDEASFAIVAGVIAALVLGKPLGIALGTWAALRLGGVALPRGLSWSGVWLAGLLGGIGFTMAIFVATLAFPDDRQLTAAKLGVLLASALAGVLGLFFGALLARQAKHPPALTRQELGP